MTLSHPRPEAEPATQPIPLPPQPDAERPAAAAAEPPRVASRWWLLAAFVIAFVLFVAHNPGQMTFDTKLGVDIDPAGFYRRLATLWNPLEFFGGVQDQYIGYAFPMGTFSLLGHLLAVPVWLVERLWMSLLVAVGLWGLVRLAEALRIGNPRTRLLAGTVFALWPTYTILIGSTSAAVLPGMLAPWAVLPLVTGARQGSTRLAAARSGAVVLAMGGVNAVSTLAALVLPALFILTRPPGPRRRSLLLWWIPAVLLASSWWLIPLFFQRAYGFDFLPYIEQAANTTQTMSASAALRGSGNWVAYLNFGAPWLSAGWAVVSGPLVIAASSVAAAVGLYGLARRDLPTGRWLRLAAGFAALIVLAGYSGPLGGPFHDVVRHLLDGTLAPFRNVYKVEPVLAAVLALGIAHGLERVRQPAAAPTPAGQWSLICRGVRPLRRWGAAALTAVVLVGLAVPYLTGQVLQPGAFAAVPDYWSQAAAYLTDHSPTEPAMVVPAEAHGSYTWGAPVDEPLEPLAGSPWVQRNLVPFSGAGAANMLDAAEKALESGTRVPGLTTYLARAGVRYLLVRNDLDPTQLGYTPPPVIHRTLEESGFQRVTGFGPQLTAGLIYPNTPLTTQALMSSYQAVEIYQPATPPPVPFGPVTTQATAGTMTVNGDPGSLLRLAGQGTLTSQPVVLAGESTGGATDVPGASVVTDGNRRQDNAFGLLQNNKSYTYTATGTNPPDDAHGAGGDSPRQLLSAGTQANQTVAQLSGAADVTASSYGSWLTDLPEFDPVNAFDGDPSTAWTEGSPGSAAGQWLQITFDHQRDLPAVAGIQLLADTPQRPKITSITATTAAGTATTELSAIGTRQTLRLPAGRTNQLRITITGTTGGTPGGLGAGITEVELPGVQVTRFLAPAQTGAGTATNPATNPVTFSFHRNTNPPQGLPSGQPEGPLARTFTTGAATDLRVSATAVAVPGSALNGLLDGYRPGDPALAISASSTWGSLPQFRASNLIDGDYRTGWVAGGADPVLHLSWSGDRTISELNLLATTGLASAPTQIELSSLAGTVRVPVPAGGDVRFAPLTTDRLDISFPTLADNSTFNPVLGTAARLPVGLTELYLPALADLRRPAADPAGALALSCGSGPTLRLDGQDYQTSVHGTVGDLTDFTPVTVTLCTPDGTLHLDAGKHWLSAPGSSGPLAITDLSMSDAPATSTAGTTDRNVAVLNWGAENRQVRIGAGSSTYLEVHEAYNTGWKARLNGVDLMPVQLDGWQQGFLVPAGSGGTVTLSFPAGTHYRQALGGSAVGVLVLGVGALMPGGRRPRNQADARRTHRTISLGGRIGALVVVTVLFVVIGGVAAVLVPLLAGLGYLRPRWLPWLAGGAMLAAGACSAIGLAWHVGTPGYGAFGAPAQVFALAALAAALTPLPPEAAVPPSGEARLDVGSA
jgi:arabinofuranan 3-O-arabinosyltransferase